MRTQESISELVSRDRARNRMRRVRYLGVQKASVAARRLTRSSDLTVTRRAGRRKGHEPAYVR